jgi:putative ABC transport system ATP-binding protein
MSSSHRLLVEARDLQKSYRRGAESVHALRGVSLQLHEAELVGLVGPSGSGKSTLLNLLAGWERPDAGAVAWAGGDPGPGGPSWAALALVPQTFGLLEELSVRENVELPLRLAGVGATARSRRVDEALAALGIDALADRAPWEGSLGEQQRTALARALVGTPRLLLCDEPTGHQDAAWAKHIFQTLLEAARQGTACLVATHSQQAVHFADRVLGLRDGELRLVAASSSEE